MRLDILLAAAAVLTFIPGTSGAAPPASPLKVRSPTIRPGPLGGATAAYMTLINVSAHPISLGQIDCTCAEMTMVHRSTEEAGVAHMAMAGEIVVPAHGEVTLKPGGLHLMVMGLKHPIHLGEHVSMRLSLDSTSPVTVSFTAAR